ncbi:uncharacterized protein si:ch211-196h16.5 [Triplophysa rosa]|uniref:uncharacterized protein si:ch211-196h16.5 n=1 Tax=Triplophysa rosa TaxID=992332 RepID=UPI002545E8BC|nr:uncharacterized protein si:ch211-196h16.5 [Triplophysa rosa]
MNVVVHLIQMSNSKSAKTSCVSMKSDQSMEPPLKFNTSADLYSRPQSPQRSDPPEPSIVSMKSDQSMEPPLKFNTPAETIVQKPQQTSGPPEPSSVSMKSDQSMEPPLKFNTPADLHVCPKPQQTSDAPEPSSVSMDPHKIVLDYSSLVSECPEVLNTFRSNLQRKFECLCEGISKQGNPTLLNKIYTELYITERESGEISNEHEMRQIETQSRRTETEDTPIKCKDIFKPLPAQDKPIRRVLTKGVAGIGKTVSVQKFILDWAEGKENQDVHLIFPLPFRELNLMKDQKLSLLELLRVFFPETKEMEISSGDYKVLFIFDGLDECRVSLDFRSRVRLCDVSESVSVDVMLTNLMAGHLLPSALIWITSRPAAADLIPSECVDRVTEVRGFTDKQKEKYFRKRISDESLNNRIISHLKSSRSLYNMCHIPVFCWISATVLERMLSKTKRKAKSEGEIPKTLTEMYTHFLIIQTNIKHQKDYEKNDEDMMLKLGKLAFEQLVKGNLIFYDEDLRECGIDVAEASVYSGLCTQIFREEFGLYQGKVYCFLHLTVQEHLAALHVLFSFLLYNEDVLIQSLPSKHSDEFSCDTISDVHQRAVDKALQSKNGHLDLFLRFLLGLSLESNQKLLQDLLTRTVNDSWSKEKTVEYIKIRIRMNPLPEKSINLFHCLNELGDQSLVNEVQEFVKSGNLSSSRFSSSQWSAVVFVLLTSEQLDVFELNKYISPLRKKDDMTPDEVLLKLRPVVDASKSARLHFCKLSEKCCAGLASVLTSKSSFLRDSNLSGNSFGDSGVKLLSDALKNPNCKLEKLRLSSCNIKDEGCVALTSVLRSNSSHLRELDLSRNKNLGDSGVKLLSAGLENPNCKLKKLVLWKCNITDEGCAALASALKSNSHLRKLNLTNNNLGDSGVKLLSDVLENPNCKLEKLVLRGCGVTEGCVALASALISNSHLRDMNLSRNKLGDSGVKLLSAGLENPNCKLEKLKLTSCGVRDEGCVALASALRSNSHLRKLNLSENNLGDSGVKLLSAGLENPNCKLEKLRLSDCAITGEGCVALTAALGSNPSHLRVLDLSMNILGHSVKEQLSDLKKEPHYKLGIVVLWDDYDPAFWADDDYCDWSDDDGFDWSDDDCVDWTNEDYCDLTADNLLMVWGVLQKAGLTTRGNKALMAKDTQKWTKKVQQGDSEESPTVKLTTRPTGEPSIRQRQQWYERDGGRGDLSSGRLTIITSVWMDWEEHQARTGAWTDDLWSEVRLLGWSCSLSLGSVQRSTWSRSEIQTPVCQQNAAMSDTVDHHHNLNDEHESSCFGLIQMDRSDPPEPSCVSMKSHQSLDPPSNFRKHSDLGFRPEPSCVSMKSHQSLDPPSNFKKQTDHGFRSDPPEPSGVSMKSHQSLDPPSNFNKQTDLGFRSDPPEPSAVSMKSHQSLDPPSNFAGNNNLPVLRPDQQSRLKPAEPDCHSCDSQSPEVLNTFRSNLQRKFECLCEGISKQGNPTLLNKIYTELYITERESGEISNEHEMRQIETQSRRTETEDTPIKCKDIFKPLPAQDKPIRRVLTKGVAGIGKTVSVQKFILDWAEGKENQDVHLIFPLPFRELNLMKDQKLSLLELLRVFFPETKEMEISSGDYKVLFIFDGLDECRVSLDFRSRVRLCDVSESVSVDVMLTNLMAGHLLPSALIWITSRPAAADLIPSECVDRVTEVRGFTDKQKEKYFRKRISDESLNNRIISHLKSSRSLYNMCHIPVFCWISATVLERMLSKTKRKAKSEGEIPKTLTEMYTHFLIIQTNIKHQKDYEKNDEDMMLKLGKLAFEQLVKGNLIFYDEDLRECGIDVAEASVYSGLCTQIFREEFGLYQGKVYCFLHLTVQEHLAALHVLFSFLLYNEDVLIQSLPSKHSDEFSCDTISDVHQRAVDKALQSKNGHLDLFLRFLLGLSLESNQKLLQDLLTRTVNDSWSNEKTVEYIKNRIRMNPSPEKSINLFHCLNELGDQSLVNEVQEFVKSGNLSSSRFSSSQWSAVVFVLLTSEQLDVFELSKYVCPFKNKDDMTSDKVLLKLRPVVDASKSAQLSDCKLTEKCCACLTEVLTSNSSCLRDLNLSGNYLGDLGVKLLSGGLKNPNCKLETLVLWDCGVTEEGCVALSSALKSNPSHLRKLNLSGNNLGGSGVKLLSARLKNPSCKLETLELSRCGVTDDGCDGLAAALRSNSHLRDLNLSDNNLGSTGVKLISAGLENPNCKLETLQLSDCGVADKGCVALASALISNSHLRELNLSRNKLGGSGVKMLSAGLKNPNCKLEKLVLWDCGVTDKGCAALASGLRSNSHLRKLNLKKNTNLGDSGVKLLSAGLENPNCKLEKLELSRCGVTHKGCVALASALKSNPSHLRELNLSENNIGGSGVELLSATLKNPKCKLEILRLRCCGITDEGCHALASALKLNPSYLKDLNLSENNLGDSGVKKLSAVLKNCKLETLRLWDCGVTDEGCVASALRSNSHLKKLHQTVNRTRTFGNEAAL